MSHAASPTRAALLRTLAENLPEPSGLSHPLRVGIDGVSASGKTILADELADHLRAQGRHVIRASLDGFHNSPAIRHLLGPSSAEGYLRDSFDYAAARTHLLEPLGPGGNLRYRSAAYDHHAERPLETPLLSAPSASVLIFEGVMLFRPELAPCFDYKILVQVTFDVALERARSRDLPKFGSMETLLQKYNQRFIPGQKRYLAANQPETQAQAIIQNEDPANPTLHFPPAVPAQTT